jgi:alcohol dehydrogenase
MSDYGLKKDDLAQYAKDARTTMPKLFDCEPVPLSGEDSTAILQAAYR